MLPTAMSMKMLRENGYLVEKVEHWDSFGKVRRDLFGIIDVLAVRPGEIVGVQVTSKANMSARQRKCEETEHLERWLEGGGQFQIHGWAKRCYEHMQWSCVECECGRETRKGPRWDWAVRVIEAPWNGAGAADTDVGRVAQGS